MANNNGKYNRTSISGLFDGKFGSLSIKVTPELLEKLSLVKEGGWLQVNRVKEETRERIANERGKEIAQTIAAYLEFSEPADESAPAVAPAAAKKPAVKAATKVERF